MARKVALILGGGLTAWDDFKAAREMVGGEFLTIACNHAARDHDGPLDHWVTMHPELVHHWLLARREAGRPEAGEYWTALHRVVPKALPPFHKIKTIGGSSGMLCVQVGLQLECSHMILCGVPMHQNGKHYDKSIPWTEARQYLPAWERNLPLIQGRVKSLQGETRRLLGEPTREWLDGDTAG